MFVGADALIGPQTALCAASPLREEGAFGRPLVNHARPMSFSSPAPSIWLTVARRPFQNTAQLLNTQGSAFAAGRTTEESGQQSGEEN